MKKTFTVLALLLISTMTFAAKPLKVKSGDLSFKQDAAVAKLVMDYSNAKWEEKKSYEEFCEEDYDSRVQQSYLAVMTGFNSLNPALKLTNDEEAEAKYTVTVQLTNLERKMWDIASFYIRIEGIITVVNNETGEEVCSIEIKKLKGSASYVPDTRLFSCFQELGFNFAKLK